MRLQQTEGRTFALLTVATHYQFNMKKILVTGANKGIGLGIVKKLLRDFPDTYLLLGSRDVARGEAAVKEILSEMGRRYICQKINSNSFIN